MSGLDLGQLFAEVEADVTAAFRLVDLAEDEIDQAMARHPDQADRLYHSFRILGDVDPRVMRVERGYRSHCAELLDRIARGEDTRPGTATEVCLVCCDSSLSAPLTESAAGLYERMFRQAFPEDHAAIWRDVGQHYQGLHGWEIDSLEDRTRKLAARPSRVVGDVDCPGTHHGEPAPRCPYYTTPRQTTFDLEGTG